MPARWKQALKGKGTVDLSYVQLEREDQLLWSVESIVDPDSSQAKPCDLGWSVLTRNEEAFNHLNFKGHLIDWQSQC